MPTLNRRTADAAPPAHKPYRLNDDRVRGLHLRVQPSGVKSYCVVYARNQTRTLGKHPQMTLAAAREVAKKVLADPLGTQTRKRTATDTFGAFVEGDYKKWVITEQKAGAATIANLKAQFGAFWNKRMTEISAFGIEKFKSDRLRQGIKPATVNRDLIRVRAALSKAVEWKLLDEHPLRGVKPAKGVDDSRVRFLDVDEEKRLRDALSAREEATRRARLSGNAWAAERGRELRPVWKKGEFVDHVAPFVLLALNTGLRRGELFGLTWKAVSIGRKTLEVKAHTSKKDETRYLPLNAEAVDVLTRWKERGSGDGLVFPGVEGGKMTNINKSWASLMTKAKLVDFRFHDCRHHFASKFVMAGTSLFVVKTLLGHSTIEMTERYSHLAPEHLADAVEKLVAK